MLSSIKKDTLVSFLLQRCSLTEAQLDTIMASQIDGNLQKKVSFRDAHAVSIGAFMRTLRQGQKNIEGAMYTLFLLNYIGLVQEKDLSKVARLGALISKVKESSPDPQSVGELVKALEEFAEGFSGRRKLIV